jgi:hypothetical protein
VTNPAGTITGNLGNLANIINSITSTQNQALRGQYPGEYFSTLGTLLGNVGRRAAGDISDLLPELQTRNAELAAGGGFSGSAMANTKLLRDLGLTRYGVEQQALGDLGTIQSEIPKTQPYDPTGVIAALIDAQQRADLYRAAPDPEAAYRRALQNARGGGGGTGTGPGGPVRPGVLGGGAGASIGSVDDVLRRYGSGLGYGPPIIARGTRAPDYTRDTAYGGAPLFDPTGGGGGYESDESWLANLFGGDQGGGEPGPVTQGGDYWSSLMSDTGLFPGQPAVGGGGPGDFGGSLAYGGGADYYGNQDLFS